MREKVQHSIQRGDDFVIVFRYRDAKGAVTNRVVSPIRLLGSDRFLGLCLSREQPRQFYLERCEDLQLKPAWDFVMPVAI